MHHLLVRRKRKKKKEKPSPSASDLYRLRARSDLEDGGAMWQRRGRSRWRGRARCWRLVGSGGSADGGAHRSGIRQNRE